MALIERGGAGGGVAFMEGCHRTPTTPEERSKGWLEVRGKRAVIVRRETETSESVFSLSNRLTLV